MKGVETIALVVGVVLALVELWGVTFDAFTPEMLGILTACIFAAIAVSVIANRAKGKNTKTKSGGKSKGKK